MRRSLAQAQRPPRSRGGPVRAFRQPSYAGIACSDSGVRLVRTTRFSLGSFRTSMSSSGQKHRRAAETEDPAELRHHVLHGAVRIQDDVVDLGDVLVVVGLDSGTDEVVGRKRGRVHLRYSPRRPGAGPAPASSRRHGPVGGGGRRCVSCAVSASGARTPPAPVPPGAISCPFSAGGVGAGSLRVLGSDGNAVAPASAVVPRMNLSMSRPSFAACGAARARAMGPRVGRSMRNSQWPWPWCCGRGRMTCLVVEVGRAGARETSAKGPFQRSPWGRGPCAQRCEVSIWTTIPSGDCRRGVNRLLTKVWAAARAVNAARATSLAEVSQSPATSRPISASSIASQRASCAARDELVRLVALVHRAGAADDGRDPSRSRNSPPSVPKRP